MNFHAPLRLCWREWEAVQPLPRATAIAKKKNACAFIRPWQEIRRPRSPAHRSSGQGQRTRPGRGFPMPLFDPGFAARSTPPHHIVERHRRNQPRGSQRVWTSFYAAASVLDWPGLACSPRMKEDVTRILSAVERGDPDAAEKLLPLVYEELRKLAAARLANEKPGQTLQPTALVHEAYLRLVGGANPEQWNSRGHFFAAAAVAIRRILIDNARRKQSLKHGGRFVRRELDEVSPCLPEPREDLLALDDALQKLAVVH